MNAIMYVKIVDIFVCAQQIHAMTVVSIQQESRQGKRRNRGNAGPGKSKQEILLTLRRRIANQILSPGSRLHEKELSEEYGISRTTIRELLGALEQRGLVERLPNRGAVVTRLDPDEIFKLFDLREVLEGLCARKAAENADPASWLDLCEGFGEPAARMIAMGDLKAYFRLLETFAARMIAAADNELLSESLESLRDKTLILQRRVLVLPNRAEQGLAEHREVLNALRRGDPAGAEEAKRRNIVSARQCLARYRRFVL